MLKKNFVPCSTVFWSSKYENIEWKKLWSITNKFFISNKVKEVSFKILHRIYPVKELFERFKLDMENSCDFCGVVKESLTHPFFQCIYSRLFGVNVSNIRLFPSASCHQALTGSAPRLSTRGTSVLPQQTTTLLFCG